jgi:transposase InsO family protein
MREDGEQLGRFKVRSLMRELDLVSKQPGSHAYKRATVKRLDIPDTLNRDFDVPASNQVWCGDITYIWAQGEWHYLAVVLVLCTRRIVGWALSEKPDAELVIKALDMAYEQRGISHFLMHRYNWIRLTNSTVGWRQLGPRKNLTSCPGLVEHCTSGYPANRSFLLSQVLHSTIGHIPTCDWSGITFRVSLSLSSGQSPLAMRFRHSPAPFRAVLSGR